MKRLAIIGLALLLSACFGGGSRPEPEIRTVEVKVPVPIPCKADVGPRPTYADQSADSAPDIFEKVKLLLIGREERKARETVLEGAVVGCGGSAK